MSEFCAVPTPRLHDDANDRLPTGMDVGRVLNRNPLLAVAETGLEIVRGVRFCLLVDVAIAQLRGAAFGGNWDQSESFVDKISSDCPIRSPP